MQLTKHHGLGNDFLVLLDLKGERPIDASMARALCDRHCGIGADGIMRVTTPPTATSTPQADVTMELLNADGSRAEISGNGIRCLGQAVIDAGIVSGPELLVATDAGVRRLTVRPTEQPGLAWVSVEMGTVTLIDGDVEACNVDTGRRRVDIGNPHLVLLGPDPATLAVERIGPDLEAGYPGGMNVEFVALGPGRDEITMRVWERGVGETLACGSGACAAAAAVHSWGKVGTKVTVHQPGGAAEVDLTGDQAILTGPTQFIASIEVPDVAVTTSTAAGAR
jgi:diaminopimelate epimerase